MIKMPLAALVLSFFVIVSSPQALAIQAIKPCALALIELHASPFTLDKLSKLKSRLKELYTDEWQVGAENHLTPDQIAEIETREAKPLGNLNLDPVAVYNARSKFLQTTIRRVLYFEYSNLVLKKVDLQKVFVKESEILQPLGNLNFGPPPSEAQLRDLIGFLATDYDILPSSDEDLAHLLALQKIEFLIYARQRLVDQGITLKPEVLEAMRSQIVALLPTNKGLDTPNFRMAIAFNLTKVTNPAPKNPCCGSGCANCSLFALNLVQKNFDFSDETLSSSRLVTYRAFYSLKEVLRPELFQYDRNVPQEQLVPL